MRSALFTAGLAGFAGLFCFGNFAVSFLWRFARWVPFPRHALARAARRE
jgi:hypothetical protein